VAIPELADGFDAIGLSQGGVLLRSMVQLYPDPPVRNLITVGSPHMGVARLPPCGASDYFCKAAEWALRTGVWSGYAQGGVIPAQYFRNQEDIATYLTKSGWLREVNNERWGDKQVGGSEDYLEGNDGQGADRSPRNSTLKENFLRLENFVMFRFRKEVVIDPPTSTFFTLPNITETEWKPIPYRRLPLYSKDYIGLKALDERGGVHLGTCEGEHMQIDDDCWADILSWLGPDGKGSQSIALQGLTIQIPD